MTLKSARLALFFAWAALLAPIGASAKAYKEPIVIAVFDSPIDYQHSQIKDFLDYEIFKELLVTEDSTTLNWFEYNQKIRAEYEALFEEQKKKLKEPSFFDNFRPTSKLRENHNTNQSRYHHGTHVAGLAIQGLHNTKLISFVTIEPISPPLENEEALKAEPPRHNPKTLQDFKEKLRSWYRYLFTHPQKSTQKTQLSDQEKLELESVFSKHMQVYQEAQRSYYASISYALKKVNVRIVNMSYSFQFDLQIKRLERQQKLGYIPKNISLEKLAMEEIKILVEETHRFFRKNPDTIFVVSAANNGTDLDDIKNTIAKVQAPDDINKTPADAKDLDVSAISNMVVVGATTKDGYIAKFSNYSPKYVPIAAWGRDVPSAKIGGGEIALSGTSMAAPAVTNRLAQVLENSPELSSEQAIEYVYRNEVLKKEKLTKYIVDGRFLSVEPLSIPAPKLIVQIAKPTFDALISKIIGLNPKLNGTETIKKTLHSIGHFYVKNNPALKKYFKSLKTSNPYILVELTSNTAVHLRILDQKRSVLYSSACGDLLLKPEQIINIALPDYFSEPSALWHEPK